VDLVDRFAQRFVELRVAHLVAQVVQQRAAEAGDDATVLRQFGASLGAAEAAGQSDDAQHLGMIHQRIEQAWRSRQRQLQHHLLALGQRVQILEDFLQQYLVGLGALGGLDVHFGLDDRHQSPGEHLAADVELLRDHGGDALAIGEVDDRPLLGAEHAQPLGAGEQGIEFGHRLHHLDAVRLVLQALVDLDEGDDAALDQRGRGRLAIDAAVHGAFEQDRAQHLLSTEGRRGDDAAAHRVDKAEHLLVVRPGAFLDAIALERLGRRTAALVERGDEAVTLGDLLLHILIQHLHIPSLMAPPLRQRENPIKRRLWPRRRHGAGHRPLLQAVSDAPAAPQE